MDGFGKTLGEDLGLKTTFQEVLNVQSEHVIELHLVFGQDTHEDETTQQHIAFKQTLGILV
jgi:hypothetical protein